jgi:hypothetical protein
MDCGWVDEKGARLVHDWQISSYLLKRLANDPPKPKGKA